MYDLSYLPKKDRVKNINYSLPKPTIEVVPVELDLAGWGGSLGTSDKGLLRAPMRCETMESLTKSRITLGSGGAE